MQSRVDALRQVFFLGCPVTNNLPTIVRMNKGVRGVANLVTDRQHNFEAGRIELLGTSII